MIYSGRCLETNPEIVLKFPWGFLSKFYPMFFVEFPQRLLLELLPQLLFQISTGELLWVYLVQFEFPTVSPNNASRVLSAIFQCSSKDFWELFLGFLRKFPVRFLQEFFMGILQEYQSGDPNKFLPKFLQGFLLEGCFPVVPLDLFVRFLQKLFQRDFFQRLF